MEFLFGCFFLSILGFLFLLFLSFMMFFDFPYLLIEGKQATGSKKGVPLLEAAICNLLIGAYCYYKMKKNYLYY